MLPCWCYSPSYDLDACPWRAAAGVPIGATGGARGIIVAGVPIGENAYVAEVLRHKADEIIEYIDATTERLREHPHALWAALYYCCQSRFDYWLRHVPPRHTAVPAANIDAALLHAFSTLTYLRRLPGWVGDASEDDG